LAGALVLFAIIVRALFNPGASTFATIAAFPLLATVAAFLIFARTKTLRNRAAAALEQAQALALANVLADFPNGAVASQLASLLQISHTRAEQLLTRLNIRDDIESMVADDGQLLFRIRGGGTSLTSHSAGRLRLPNDLLADADSTDVEGETPERRSPQKAHGE
jgi:hypothetical protein